MPAAGQIGAISGGMGLGTGPVGGGQRGLGFGGYGPVGDVSFGHLMGGAMLGGQRELAGSQMPPLYDPYSLVGLHGPARVTAERRMREQQAMAEQPLTPAVTPTLASAEQAQAQAIATLEKSLADVKATLAPYTTTGADAMTTGYERLQAGPPTELPAEAVDLFMQEVARPLQSKYAAMGKLQSGEYMEELNKQAQNFAQRYYYEYQLPAYYANIGEYQQFAGMGEEAALRQSGLELGYASGIAGLQTGLPYSQLEFEQRQELAEMGYGFEQQMREDESESAFFGDLLNLAGLGVMGGLGIF